MSAPKATPSTVLTEYQRNRKMSLENLVCWTMAAICTRAKRLHNTYIILIEIGGGGGVYGYMQKKSIPSLIAGLGFGTLYGLSGYWIQSGRPLDGVDLSICTC